MRATWRAEPNLKHLRIYERAHECNPRAHAKRAHTRLATRARTLTPSGIENYHFH